MNQYVKVIFGILFSFQITRALYKKAKEQYRFHQARQLRRRRDEKSVEIPHVDPRTQSYILSLSAKELANAIKAGKVTSLQATATYIQRAYTIGRSLSLTAEEPFEEALALAKERDEDMNPTGKLHGVPISIKDEYRQKNCHASCGYIYKALIKCTQNAEIIECMLEEGAVPFIRSNVPQGEMWFETENHTYGRSENPWDRSKTTGGSSGGEGGLVASRCSVLGFGSDIGGSIRIPSAFCGVYGFKPSPSRSSEHNIDSPNPPDYTGIFELYIPPVPGPLGRTVKDLKLAMDIIWTRQKDPFVDSYTHYEKAKEKLRVGYFTDLKFFEAVPSIRRAVLDCKDKLESQGHSVVKFDFPRINHANQLFMQMFWVANDDIDECMGEKAMYFNEPDFLFSQNPVIKLVRNFLLKITKNNRLMECLFPESMESLELHYKIREYIEEIVDYWQGLELDAVICPTIGITSVDHTTTVDIPSVLQYTVLWNLLRFPAGVVPVGFVQPDETDYPSDYDDLITANGKKANRNVQGLPVCVQVVGLPFRDEKVLDVMEVIESCFQFHFQAI